MTTEVNYALPHLQGRSSWPTPLQPFAIQDDAITGLSNWEGNLSV